MSNIRELIEASRLDKVDARVLLAHLIQKHLGWPKSSLISKDTEILPTALIEEWRQLEKKRLEGHPVAYLTGKKEFFNIELAVAPGVLIPRPETELLVELALAYIQEKQLSSPRILDLGTGTGAIGLALAKNCAKAQVFCVDLSSEALMIAKANAASLDLNTVQFYQGSWFEALPQDIKETQSFDIILSNPPYIPAGDHHLSEGDLRFEPSSALTDGDDGLTAYRDIFEKAHSYLLPEGLILVEHGHDQSAAICELLYQFNYSSIKTHQDLAGISRVVTAQHPSFAKLG